MSTEPQPPEIAASQARASIASWLGVLFLLVLLLVGVGGFVRLTQSGLSLPGWPFVNGKLLPPVTEAGWTEMYGLYLEDMDQMIALQEQGKVGLGALGHMPRDLADFQRIFIIEWSHRAIAIIVGLVGLACLMTIFRKPALRQLAGRPLTAIVSLIVVQSIIGGILVHTYTSTHWLFVHLGVATLILGLILWTLLLMLRSDDEPLAQRVHEGRSWPRRWATAALMLVFIQIILGALVAGSRHNGFSTTWPTMNGELIPTLWMTGKGLMWNLLDNPTLHQWVHRWFAWTAVIAVAAMTVMATRAPLGLRGRIAVRVAFSTLIVQVILGIMNVQYGAAIPIALSHLIVGMILYSALVLAVFDMRNEPECVADETPQKSSRLAMAGGQP